MLTVWSCSNTKILDCEWKSLNCFSFLFVCTVLKDPSIAAGLSINTTVGRRLEIHPATSTFKVQIRAIGDCMIYPRIAHCTMSPPVQNGESRTTQLQKRHMKKVWFEELLKWNSRPEKRAIIAVWNLFNAYTRIFSSMLTEKAKMWPAPLREVTSHGRNQKAIKLSYRHSIL